MKWTKEEKRAYGIYKKTYHRAIIGHKYEYMKRFSAKEFREWYRNAKLAPASKKHPIKSIVQAQQISDNKKFTEAARKQLGGKLTKEFREDPEFRKGLFRDYVDDLRDQGMSQKEARQAAEDYYGY